MIPNRFKYKLFGRFKGRKKIHHPFFQDLKKYQFNLEKNINKSKYNILDIGSGSGENALFLSDIYPKSKIITCELFDDGNINLAKQIKKKKNYEYLFISGKCFRISRSCRALTNL